MSDLPFSAKHPLPHGRWLKATLTMFLSLFLLVGTAITLNADAQESYTYERPSATNDMLTELLEQDRRLDVKLTVTETQGNVPLSPFSPWTSDNIDETTSVAWGDMDGDGDLDLAAGNDGANKVYLNENGWLQATAVWASDDSDRTYSVAWGDVDGDGDLDLATGNDRQVNKVYLNEDGELQTTAVWGVAALQNTPKISAYAGKWVHVTTSFDASSKVLKTYFNGVEVDSDTGVNPINIQPAGGDAYRASNHW